MNFRLDIEMDNAAFYDDDDGLNTNELVLILIRVGHAIDAGNESGLARDTNGACVGNWRIQ